ncbi:MAG: mechanosensitive ion channel, partial [Bacteroidota bacterium]|nr:mechanosensitive ion channel [Bacteroidota bacterium]
EHIDKFESRTLGLINILAVIYSFSIILSVFEVYRPVIDWCIKTLEYEWVIKSLTISIGGVFLLILILLITFIVSKFVKVLIEDEIAPRINLPKGVPFAISITIRYFIIILGFVLALSAAGIEPGNFGLMAGALGIGIGFGLQNIVGNFISGLILVYERPVNVGDTIEVESLMGQVKSIGIRASNVKTYDGAEVVVPNSNLISNQLINWTLSDNRRRLEIKVGVAYGSDPNIVLELLKKVAVGNDEVLKSPEPLALFDEFGDSSLNFRLLFWVHFEKGFTLKSDIAIGIYNILDEHNITIPFPQVDLNVKREE